MVARLQVEVESSATGLLPGALEGDYFSVILSRLAVISGGDDPSAPHQHGPDHGIRTRPSGAPKRQAKRQAHVFLFDSIRHQVNRFSYPFFSRPSLCPVNPLRSFNNSSSSTMNSLMSLKERYTDAKRT